MVIQCPGCSQKLKLRTGSAERELTCPSCGKKFTVATRGSGSEDSREAILDDQQTDPHTAEAPAAELSNDLADLDLGDVPSIPTAQAFPAAATQVRRRQETAKPAEDPVKQTAGIDQRWLMVGGFVTGMLVVALIAGVLFFLFGRDNARSTALRQPSPSGESTPPASPVLRTTPEPPVYVPLPKGNIVDLYDDPPSPTSADQYDSLSANLVNEQRVQVRQSKDRMDVLLLPIVHLELGKLAKDWIWKVESTKPLKFLGRSFRSGDSEHVNVTVEPNTYADVDSYNQAKRLKMIDQFVKSNYKRVSATEVQAVTNTRYQFYVGGDSSRHEVVFIIHDEDRVITFEIFDPLRSEAEEIHQSIAMAELLARATPGNVPADVEAELAAVVKEAKELIAAKEYVQTLLLISDDDNRARLNRNPAALTDQVFQTNYKSKLMETFELMDYSKATYESAINRVSFPYKKSDIVWEKINGHWAMK